MRGVVVYESMFGSTRTVAEAVAQGMRSWCDEVTTVPVGQAEVEDVAHADLLVVGGPTHVHGLSRPTTRQAAADAPEQYGHGADLEPEALGVGLREWFDALPELGGQAATFDTRVDMPAMVTGRASKGIAKRLRHHGFHLVDDPQSFLVAKDAGLQPGETEKAEAWGQALGRTLGLRPTSSQVG